MTYEILTDTIEYKGGKKTLTVKLLNGDITLNQYVELEPFEYMSENDNFELEENQDLIEVYLQNLSEQWILNNF